MVTTDLHQTRQRPRSVALAEDPVVDRRDGLHRLRRAGCASAGRPVDLLVANGVDAIGELPPTYRGWDVDDLYDPDPERVGRRP